MHEEDLAIIKVSSRWPGPTGSSRTKRDARGSARRLPRDGRRAQRSPRVRRREEDPRRHQPPGSLRRRPPGPPPARGPPLLRRRRAGRRRAGFLDSLVTKLKIPADEAKGSWNAAGRAKKLLGELEAPWASTAAGGRQRPPAPGAPQPSSAACSAGLHLTRPIEFRSRDIDRPPALRSISELREEARFTVSLR